MLDTGWTKQHTPIPHLCYAEAHRPTPCLESRTYAQMLPQKMGVMSMHPPIYIRPLPGFIFGLSLAPDSPLSFGKSSYAAPKT
jgi:hypothetical protein